MLRKNNFLGLNLFSVLCLIAIVFLSLYNFAPSDDISKIPYIDKIVHGMMYAGFSISLMFDKTLVILRKEFSGMKNGCYQKEWFNLPYIVKVILISTSLGILMEFAQKYMTTYRCFDVNDIFANFTGAVIGAFVGRVVMKYIIKVFIKYTILYKQRVKGQSL